MGQRSAGIRAHVDRDPRVIGGPHCIVTARVQCPHVLSVAGELFFRRRRDVTEGGDIDQSRHDGDAMRREQRDRLVGEPGGVLDAVDTGLDEVGQGALGEAVRGDPGTDRVRGLDRGAGHVPRPAWGEVPGVAVDPVTDEFDPAVTAPGLLDDVRE